MLTAAYAILEDAGIAKFSIDAVARRSGVARTTIYRWWPNKSVLAVESFLKEFEPRLTFQRSGAADVDFQALVASLANALSGPAGRVAASVIAQAQTDPETQRLFRETFSESLRAHSIEVLRAGTEQQRFRADLNVGCVIDAFVGAIYLRLLMGSPLDPVWAKALSDTLLSGCLSGDSV